MTSRRDQAIVAVLVLLLVVLGGSIALPANAVPAASRPSPTEAVDVPTYREGILGRPESITPLTARNRAERTLVGLLFSGLTRVAADGTVQPDLASSWQTSEDGKTWTFRIRDDARWHDSTPVSAADVSFTVRALRDPEAPGPVAASWTEVTVNAVDERTVRFTLESPLAGFAAAASQPLLPAHILEDVPLGDLPSHPFGRLPVGSGPYALARLSANGAYLEAVALRPGTSGGASPRPTDALATPGATRLPAVAVPYLPRLEMHFFDEPGDLEAAFRAGDVDVASGLGPAAATALARAVDGAQLVRFPSTTLTTVLLDQRPAHAELRDPRVRRALLGALDRDALIVDALGGGGLRAGVPYPPTAPFWDADSAKATPFDREAAGKLLEEAGWTKGDEGWVAPKQKAAYRIELLAPSADANPTIRGVADAVAEQWTAFGLSVLVVELEPAQLASRLEEGAFAATIVDIRLGPDLDLYPLLAASQTTTGGGNLAGYQDPALDQLLTAARTARTDDARRAAVASLLAKLSTDVPILPLAWRDDPIVVRGISGVVPRLVVDAGDRFRDVLAWRLASDG